MTTRVKMMTQASRMPLKLKTATLMIMLLARMIWLRTKLQATMMMAAKLKLV